MIFIIDEIFNSDVSMESFECDRMNFDNWFFIGTMESAITNQQWHGQ